RAVPPQSGHPVCRAPPDRPGHGDLAARAPGHRGPPARAPSGAGRRAGKLMGRTVTLVLVDADGGMLGALPPFDVDVPWWQEVGDVVDAARARPGIGVQVLRLLHADGTHPPGGHVTYL